MRNIIIFMVLLLFSCKSNIVDKKYVKTNNDIINKINTLKGKDLGDFIYELEHRNIDLSIYNSYLIKKLEQSTYPYDLFTLSQKLVDENKRIVEQIINEKIELWDKAKWGNKFWTFIENNNLKVAKPSYYEFINGSKQYKVDEFLKIKRLRNDIGLNPLIFINYKLLDYESGSLESILSEYNIYQIDTTNKIEAVKLFGKSGIDGKLNILAK